MNERFPSTSFHHFPMLLWLIMLLPLGCSHAPLTNELRGYSSEQNMCSGIYDRPASSIEAQIQAAGITDSSKTHAYVLEEGEEAIRKRLITAEKQKIAGYVPTFGLHAKSMVVDHGIAAIGTFNLDPRSANLNTECVAIMGSIALASQVESLMIEELSPENAWHTTPTQNPDHHADVWKNLMAWTRQLVPAFLL